MSEYILVSLPWTFTTKQMVLEGVNPCDSEGEDIDPLTATNTRVANAEGRYRGSDRIVSDCWNVLTHCHSLTLLVMMHFFFLHYFSIWVHMFFVIFLSINLSNKGKTHVLILSFLLFLPTQNVANPPDFPRYSCNILLRHFPTFFIKAQLG